MITDNCLIITILAIGLLPQKFQAEIIVRTRSNKTFSFADIPANFGDRLPEKGLTGFIVNAIPRDGCSPIQQPPYSGPNWFALIRQGNCPYSPKVYNAQISGYRAAIVFNRDSNELVQMNGVLFVNRIQIPSVFVGADTGAQLADAFDDVSKAVVKLTPSMPVPWGYYVCSLGTVAVTCVAIILGVIIRYMYVFCQRHFQNKMARKLLDKTVPVYKYNESLECQDVCAICIEDFQKKDKVRVLLCKHAYHCKCIDPWFLVEGKRNCPLCKHSIDSTELQEGTSREVTYNNNQPSTVIEMTDCHPTSVSIESSVVTGSSSQDSSTETTPLVVQHCNR